MAEPTPDEVQRLFRETEERYLERLGELKTLPITDDQCRELAMLPYLRKSQFVALMQGFYDPHTPSDERFWHSEDFDLEVGLLKRDLECGAIAFPCKPLEACNWASTTGIKLPPAFITALTPKAPKTRGDRARRLDAVGRAARCLAEKARSQNAPFALTSIPCTKATFIGLLKALERRELGPFSDSSFDTYFDDLKMKFLPGRRKGHHDQQFEKLFPELKVG